MRLKDFLIKNVKNILLNSIFKHFLLSMPSIEHKGYVPVEETQESWRLQWETEKKQGGESRAAAVIKKGREIGVPVEEIQIFFQEVVGKRIQDDPYFVWRFVVHMGVGTAEELTLLRRRAFDQALQNKNVEHATAIAQQEWGVESIEYRQAQELEASYEIVLLPDATFFDLLDMIGQERFVHMWDYANGYVPPDVLDLIEQLLRNDPERLYSMRLVDFFNNYDYSVEDIREYLGIMFEE